MCKNPDCRAGIVLVKKYSRIKACNDCKLFEGNEHARDAVAALLDVLDENYKRGLDDDGTVADALERIETVNKIPALTGRECGTFITFEFKEHGLLMTPTEEGVAEARQAIENGNSQPDDYAMWCMLEDFLTNGWSRIYPEDVGALTDAPMISADSTLEDDGTRSFLTGGVVYAHMDYAVEDVVETWAKGESVFWTKAEVE